MDTRFDRLKLRRRRLALQVSIDAAAVAIAQSAGVLAAFEDGSDAVLERYGLTADAIGRLLTEHLDAVESGKRPGEGPTSVAAAPSGATPEGTFIPAFLRQRRE